MCTVIFIPCEGKYFFASLRDESPKRREALAPDIYSARGNKFLCTKDPMAGGTWMGVSQFGSTIILLNGGHEAHIKKKYYRKSRGLIVTELLASGMPVDDWRLMDMEDIEPYTLIVWADGNLFQLVWDGQAKHSTSLNYRLSHIWSSATLYSAAVKAHREQLFQNWIAMKPPVSKLSLLNFFKTFTDHENGFIMNRNEQIKTLSYSFLQLHPADSALLHYHDFLNNTCTSKTISLRKKVYNNSPPTEILLKP